EPRPQQPRLRGPGPGQRSLGPDGRHGRLRHDRPNDGKPRIQGARATVGRGGGWGAGFVCGGRLGAD
nr:hypothetical protein [Tanacetum cinerariifolium]